ncbi:hypothetical protein ADL21_09515 [Streptomyces albus subsp. albus]|nr:hypothetical protein ADL21_09515 [Streptomyces albus subsp. albus]
MHNYLLNLADKNPDALARIIADADAGRTFKRDDLMRDLPGFADLKHEGHRLAVVAALGRLSVGFHASHAVGVAVDNSRSSIYHWRDDIERTPARKRDILRQKNDPKLKNISRSRGVAGHEGTDFASTAPSGAKDAPPAAKAKLYLNNRYGQEAVSDALKAFSNMQPDLTGRNYAAVEVVDHKTGEVHYVVDSSVSNDKLPRPVHSEPHIGGWIERLNEGLEGTPVPEKDRYEVRTMYTEREPCGTSQGHADCSSYIVHYVSSEATTHYGTGYRKGPQAEPFDAEADLRPQVNSTRDAMNADFQRHVNALGDVFMRFAGYQPIGQP